MTKKKKIIIITSVLASVLLVTTAVLLLVFLLKPPRAREVEVEASDYHIFVKTQIVSSEQTYRFKFVTEGQTKEVDSPSHILDITDLLWEDELHLGVTYQVSVCLVEKTGVLNGDYGPAQEFTPRLKLFSPQIEYDEDRNFITWQQIKGADRYSVSYFVGENLQSFQTEDLEFDLSLVWGGDRNIFVTATSFNDGLIESDKSNVVSKTIDHQIAQITSATIDENGILTIVCKDRLSKVVIKNTSDQSQVILDAIEYDQTDEGYHITFNAKLLDKNGSYTLLPESDQHNQYSFDAVAVNFENN